MLLTILRLCNPKQDQCILDIGIGTGNLSKHLTRFTDQIWGADFSGEMLKRARKVLPQSHLIQVDLHSEKWPKAMQGPFDRILSAYTLHEFPDDDKLHLLLRFARESLAEDGFIIIGDVSYETLVHFDEAHLNYKGLWDEDEYYWCAERMLPQLEEAGFSANYQQVSDCGGVYCLTCRSE